MTKTSNIALLKAARQYYLSNQLKYNGNYNTDIKKIADQYDVISFDIFDTILTRLFECPIDVFAFVQNILEERKIYLDEFAIRRVEAEENAHHIAMNIGQCEEITLEEIYSQLATMFPNQDDALQIAQQIELETELNCIVSIVENKILIQQLVDQGKKVIFVSDMYLDKNFIESLLEKNELDFYDELYVSSDLKQTKHSGRIWETVLANNVDKKILHIGDNLYADVKVPKKYNITTFHYPFLASDRRFGAQLSPNLVPFSLMSKVSLLLTDKEEEQDAEQLFWYKLGETLGALMLKSFVDWLYEQAQKNNIDHIYFCARDAQFIQTVWNQLGYDQQSQISSSYLYVSRNLLRFPNCYLEVMKKGKLSDASLEFLVNESIQTFDTYQTYFKRLGVSKTDVLKAGFSDQFGSLEKPVDFKRIEELKIFLQQRLLTALMPLFKARCANVINYYEQEGLFDEQKNIAIVDLGWSGTIHLALTEFRQLRGVKRKLHGYYYGLINHSAGGRLYKNGTMKAAFFNLFWSKDEQFLIYNSVNILENLHSANHQTVVDIFFNNQSERYEAILKEDATGQYMLRFNRTFAVFQQGTINSLKKWQQGKTVYGISATDVNTFTAAAAIFQVCISPNQRERLYLGQIQHAPLHDHAIFYPLINNQLPKNKQDINQLLSLCMWPCGQMLSWTHMKDQWDQNLYALATSHFQHYPNFIKKHLIY